VCILPVATKLSGRNVGLGEGVSVGVVEVGLAIAGVLALGDTEGVEAGLVGVPAQPASPMIAMKPASSKRGPTDFGRSAAPGLGVTA
jgi:hypothetical protein